MFGDSPKADFGELPQALVQDVLNQSMGLAAVLQSDLGRMREEIPSIRKAFANIRRIGDLPDVPIPTSCGIDGSYIVERLLSTDLAGFAALAIEGLTPPSETRFWPDPRHAARVFAVPHHESTAQVVRGLMMCHELSLATSAPHDVVMLDNSLKTFLIYLNNATTSYVSCTSPELAASFGDMLEGAVAGYTEVLSGERRDRANVALPKYSTLRELGSRAKVTVPYDDRTLASMALNAGEFVGPLDVTPDEHLHLSVPRILDENHPTLRAKVLKLPELLNQAQVLYFKPRQYLPAFRLELAPSTAKNDSALASVLRALEFQSSIAGLFEPFPLYLADRMVSHLGVAFPSFLQAVTHEMATRHAGDVGEVYLTMHSYRSEAGR